VSLRHSENAGVSAALCVVLLVNVIGLGQRRDEEETAGRREEEEVIK